MKKTSFTATLVLAAVTLTACSQDSKQQTAAAGASSRTLSASMPASPPSAAKTAMVAPQDEVGPSRTPGARVSGSEYGAVTVTACTPTSEGIKVKVKVTNTTRQPRTFILTVMAYDSTKKVAGSAAVLVQRLAPGVSDTGTGRSDKEVKGPLTCEVAQISSLIS